METNTYTSAMSRLTVTPNLRERVLERAIAQIEQVPVQPRRRMHPLLPMALAACLLLVAAVALFPQFLAQQKEPPTLTDNPMHKVESIAQLKQAAPFPLAAPGNLPEGYTVESAYLIGGSLAQIEYTAPQGNITYRMAAGSSDISGDYTKYAETVEETVGERTITLKGDERLIKLCLWRDDAYSYSLGFDAPVSPEIAYAIIESVNSLA